MRADRLLRGSRALFVVRAALILSACGGHGPASPSGVALSHIRVVAGDTGAPVAGAEVVVGGHSVTTTAGGEVPIDTAMSGLIQIQSAGFLRREALIGTGAGDFSLWPVRGDYSQPYIESLLYRPSTSTGTGSGSPDHALNRVLDGRVSIVPSGVISADAAALAVVQQGIAIVNEAAAGHVVFSLDSVASSPVAFTLSIDPGMADGAFTERRVKDDVIVGGRIRFSRRSGFDPIRDVRYVAHELGHVLGLEHSMLPSDMMYFAVGADSPTTFTDNERMSIRLLLQRRPGNRYPDTDAAVG
jgi:hypothetical protein